MKIADLTKIEVIDEAVVATSDNGATFTFVWEASDDKRGYFYLTELFGWEKAELHGINSKGIEGLQYEVSMVDLIESEKNGYSKGWIDAIWRREMDRGEGFPFFLEEKEFDKSPEAWGTWQGEVEYSFSHESLKVYKHQEGFVLVGDMDGDWGILIPG